MEEIQKYNQSESEGAKILKKNKFFRDFTSLMRNIEFKQFYFNYFKDWTDIQTMIFYMKLYTTIEDAYFGQYNKSISDELITFTLHKIITTDKIRKVAIEMFKNFFPEEIRNWLCDDYITELYKPYYLFPAKNAMLVNMGGCERYKPVIDNDLVDLKTKYVENHKKIISSCLVRNNLK